MRLLWEEKPLPNPTSIKEENAAAPEEMGVEYEPAPHKAALVNVLRDHPQTNV